MLSVEKFLGELGEELSAEEQLSSFDEQDEQYEQESLSGIAKGKGENSYVSSHRIQNCNLCNLL